MGERRDGAEEAAGGDGEVKSKHSSATAVIASVQTVSGMEASTSIVLLALKSSADKDGRLDSGDLDVVDEFQFVASLGSASHVVWRQGCFEFELTVSLKPF